MSLDVAILTSTTTGGLVPGQSGLTEDESLQLAQRVLLELCTDLDSALALPDRGTAFLQGVRQRVFASEYDAITTVSASLATVTDALRAEESSSDSAAGRLAGVTVTQLTIAPGAMVLKLAVQSRAGQTRTVTFPIAIHY